jgi:hypothetical protein
MRLRGFGENDESDMALLLYRSSDGFEGMESSREMLANSCWGTLLLVCAVIMMIEIVFHLKMNDGKATTSDCAKELG